jgi:hypothetical protein
MSPKIMQILNGSVLVVDLSLECLSSGILVAADSCRVQFIINGLNFVVLVGNCLSRNLYLIFLIGALLLAP